MLACYLAFVLTGQDQKPVIDPSTLPIYTANSGDGNFTIAPPYADPPELQKRDNVPHGSVYRFTMDSTDSKIYPGIAKDQPGKIVPYQRQVRVYIPKQYVAGTPCPFLISQDSVGWGEIPTILDNMIAEKRLPVMAAVFIDSGGSDAQGSERGLEYDTLSRWYAEFVETEVLPRISRDYPITFSKDPDARLAMGVSSGGACAFTMAWYRPDLYHRVLTYSGTYVNQQWPPNPESMHGAWEYHEHLIPSARRKPLRVWLEVGSRDIRFDDPESTYHNWVLANVRMAAALKAKGYPYQFVLAQDAGHGDGRVTRQTLPEALAWVWKGYRHK